MVLDGVQEYGFHDGNYLLLECPVGGSVLLRHCLVLTEIVCPECLLLHGEHGKLVVTHIVGRVELVSRLGEVVVRGHS